MSIFNNLFLVLGVLGTLVFVLKTFIPVDSGSEIGGDFNGIVDTDSSFNLFTIESISAFFMCLGWMGWASTNFLHYGFKLSLAVAVISGIIGMVFFSWLISQAKKLEYTPGEDISALLNRSGKAYMNFSPRGQGKIQIEFNGRIEEIDARNNTDVEIKSFEPIKVVKIENNEVFIEKDN